MGKMPRGEGRLKRDDEGNVIEKLCSTHNDNEGAWLPIAEFSWVKAQNNWNYKCRECVNKASREIDQTARLEANARWYERNREKAKVYGQRQAAKRKAERAEARALREAAKAAEAAAAS